MQAVGVLRGQARCTCTKATLLRERTCRDQVHRELHPEGLDRGCGSWHGFELPWWSVY
jgi:hypothetical protein